MLVRVYNKPTFFSIWHHNYSSLLTIQQQGQIQDAIYYIQYCEIAYLSKSPNTDKRQSY